jgi:hypothetical protein
MTDLTFNDPDEARAWDTYVAAHACGIGLTFEGDRKLIANSADAMILERRKRMAPEKVEREWMPHNPGDPMPCDGEMLVEVWLQNDAKGTDQAKGWQWNGGKIRNWDVIAWRPA